MTDDARSSHLWWMLVGAAVFVVVGVGRLVLDISATILGSSVSCGNALAWMGGHDNTATLRAVCSAPLHNASIEGVVALIAGIILALGWLAAVGAAAWILVVLAAFATFFIVGTFAASTVVGTVAAIALLAVFSVWRLFARHRHARS